MHIIGEKYLLNSYNKGSFDRVSSLHFQLTSVSQCGGERWTRSITNQELTSYQSIKHFTVKSHSYQLCAN